MSDDNAGAAGWQVRRRQDLTRMDILYVCAAASNMTYVLTWPHIDGLGWFLLVTGPVVILRRLIPAIP
jgi:hypothetical protein